MIVKPTPIPAFPLKGKEQACPRSKTAGNHKLNNTLYAVGGTNGSSGSGTLATVEAYDPASNTWTPQASLSTARYAPALGEVNGQLYAVGGS